MWSREVYLIGEAFLTHHLTQTDFIGMTKCNTVHSVDPSQTGSCVCGCRTVCIHINLLCALRSCWWHTTYTAFISVLLRERFPWLFLFFFKYIFLYKLCSFFVDAGIMHKQKLKGIQSDTSGWRIKNVWSDSWRTELLQPPLWQMMVSASVTYIDIVTLHILHLHKNQNKKLATFLPFPHTCHFD